ncbi:hypothetical protein [Chryseolinea sp. H1M3-3]|uniref:hypothetical protein n=1 Tax=Chryseolinea sp. H1M3-3 TaxID=3034144 RepID=UPI0023EC93B0|nr:hypothetical protein [Chryseolinea sp. H1M3-3]
MNTAKYQVWEGEMEAAGLEENGVSFFSAFFSAILGIVLFFILIAKTMIEKVFRVRFSARKKVSNALKTQEFKMSVS